LTSYPKLDESVAAMHPTPYILQILNLLPGNSNTRSLTKRLKPRNGFCYFHCFWKNLDAHCLHFFSSDSCKTSRQRKSSELPDSSKI